MDRNTEIEAHERIKLLLKREGFNVESEWVDNRILILVSGLSEIEHPSLKLGKTDITPRELSTILAALRYWQQDLEREYKEAKAEGRKPIITGEHFDEHKPLPPDLIDGLCEKLNMSE